MYGPLAALCYILLFWFYIRIWLSAKPQELQPTTGSMNRALIKLQPNKCSTIMLKGMYLMVVTSQHT